MYVVISTRPDMYYAIHLLTRVMSAPTEQMMKLCKRSYRYLKGTKHFILKQQRDLSDKCLGFSDTDFANQNYKRRCLNGYCFYIYGLCVSARSKLQTLVSLSTCEAEYIGLAFAAREAIFLIYLLQALGINVQPFPILGDNECALRLTEDPVAHD